MMTQVVEQFSPAKADTPRVYVACLASYNAGRLHGAWMDVSDPDTMMDGIQAMLSQSAVYPAEEWAIHDVEGFGSIPIREYESLERLAEMVELIQEHGELAAQVIEHHCGDIDAARQSLEEDYQGCFESLADYAEQFMADTEELKTIPHHVVAYIDFERMAYDWQMSGDIFTIAPRHNEIHVFWNR